jgi:hypothetical protein
MRWCSREITHAKAAPLLALRAMSARRNVVVCRSISVARRCEIPANVGVSDVALMRTHAVDERRNPMPRQRFRVAGVLRAVRKF